MGLRIFSFGFRYHEPPTADLLFDCRKKMPNPFWIDELRPYCGEDPRTSAFLKQQPDALSFVEHAKEVIEEALKEKDDLVVAVGCTGGYHRSVFTSRQLYEYFKDKIPTTLEHIDIEKEGQ